MHGRIFADSQSEWNLVRVHPFILLEQRISAACCRASQWWTVLLTSQKTPTGSVAAAPALQGNTSSSSPYTWWFIVFATSPRERGRWNQSSLDLEGGRVSLSWSWWLAWYVVFVSGCFVGRPPRCDCYSSFLFVYPPPARLLCPLPFQLTSHRSPKARPHAVARPVDPHLQLVVDWGC
jgi:hypothetical protein